MENETETTSVRKWPKYWIQPQTDCAIAQALVMTLRQDLKSRVGAEATQEYALIAQDLFDAIQNRRAVTKRLIQLARSIVERRYRDRQDIDNVLAAHDMHPQEYCEIELSPYSRGSLIYDIAMSLDMRDHYDHDGSIKKGDD